MAIRKHLSYDHHTRSITGYVDIGIGSEENSEIATEALVFMLIGLRGKWKAPVAYYLTKSLSAESQAQLVQHVLQKLHEIGIQVHCLTMDGHGTNLGMCRLLGASMDIDQGIRPFFTVPGTDQRTYILLDPCHMVKLARNLLEAYQVVQSDKGTISWQHITDLHSEQQQLGLHLANKLNSQHINFKSQKMKVFIKYDYALSTQNLNRSKKKCHVII